MPIFGKNIHGLAQGGILLHGVDPYEGNEGMLGFRVFKVKYSLDHPLLRGLDISCRLSRGKQTEKLVPTCSFPTCDKFLNRADKF